MCTSEHRLKHSARMQIRSEHKLQVLLLHVFSGPLPLSSILQKKAFNEQWLALLFTAASDVCDRRFTSQAIWHLTQKEIRVSYYTAVSHFSLPGLFFPSCRELWSCERKYKWETDGLLSGLDFWCENWVSEKLSNFNWKYFWLQSLNSAHWGFVDKHETWK